MGHYSQYWNSLKSSRPGHCRMTTPKDEKTTFKDETGGIHPQVSTYTITSNPINFKFFLT
jgi:hypothetical protein